MSAFDVLAELQFVTQEAREDRDRLALEVEEAQGLAMANAERFADAQGKYVERTHEVRAYEKLLAQLHPRLISA